MTKFKITFTGKHGVQQIERVEADGFECEGPLVNFYKDAGDTTTKEVRRVFVLAVPILADDLVIRLVEP